jgi:hypothetical protein
MQTVSAQPKIQSFVHGLMMPIPGMKSLEKQILLEMGEASGKSSTGWFALGHMVVAYPVIIVVGFLFSKLVEMLL